MDYESIRIELKRPLLIMKAAHGFLACGYINVETCNRTGDACALVNAGNFEDMRLASVVAVSQQAEQRGIRIGDSGDSALRKLS